MMRWSRLHGDMQGGRAKDASSASDIGSKTSSEIPCRVSSDLHEWRNAVSYTHLTLPTILRV